MYCTVYSDPGRVVGEGGPESRVVGNTFETLLVLGISTLPSENKAICDFYQDQISRAGRQDSLGLVKDAYFIGAVGVSNPDPVFFS